MPEIDGIYYADASTPASLATESATQAQSIADAFNGGGPAWTAWATVPTGITVGDGTLVQRYRYSGGRVVVQGRFTLGSTSAVTASIVITHPVTCASPESAIPFPLGDVTFSDAGVYSRGIVTGLSATTCRLMVQAMSGTYGQLYTLSSTIPFTWATGDFVNWNYIVTPV